MLSSVILWIRFFISPLKWPILLILIIFLACVVRFLRSINVDTGIKLYYVRERKLLTLCPCRWSKLQYFCMNSTVFPYLLWHWLYWNIFVFIILYSTFYKHLYAFIIDNLHTSHMIIYVVNGFAKTHPSAHISLLTTAAMIIFPWGKADPESVSAVMSAVCEMVQYELPFRPQHSCTAKHNKRLIHWRKWEHVTIRAWERGRAGTPAWPSSDSTHGNNGLGSLSVVVALPCI